jgi:hypothetical protein
MRYILQVEEKPSISKQNLQLAFILQLLINLTYKAEQITYQLQLRYHLE